MERGSDKILQAWRTRLDDTSVEGIAKHFGDSSAEVISAEVDGSGGGIRVVTRYSADDFEQCGNDLAFWLSFLRRYGSEGTVVPRVIVNGKPAVDSAVLALHFGATHVSAPAVRDVLEVVAE